MKEKARELVERFIKTESDYFNTDGYDPYLDKDLAKKCALICVDEVLKAIEGGMPYMEKYWQEVKQEIQKL